MLKKATCYILILSFFGLYLSKLSIYVSFKINQDFIAAELCDYKDKPMSNCNGKCYLSKQLKKQEEKEEKQIPKERNERTELLFCNKSKLSYLITKHEFSDKSDNFPKILVFNTQDFIDDI